MLKYISLSLLVLAASFVGSLALRNAFAFTEPTAPPPGGNVPIPINVSDTAQTKQGPLTVQADLSGRRFCSVDSPTLCVDLTGTSTFGGNIDLGDVGILQNYPANYVPSAPGDLATKAYVDSKIPQPSTSGNKYIFVSSVAYDGSMSKGVSDLLSGLSLANQHCATLAADAPSRLNGTYKAWLSTSTVKAKDNVFCDNTKSYFRPDGASIASSCTDLTDGTLANAISVTEQNAPIANSHVWTGVYADGVSTSHNYSCFNSSNWYWYASTYTASQCQDWTNASTYNYGTYGQSSATNFTWSWNENSTCGSFYTRSYPTADTCNAKNRIYCVGV